LHRVVDTIAERLTFEVQVPFEENVNIPIDINRYKRKVGYN